MDIDMDMDVDLNMNLNSKWNSLAYESEAQEALIFERHVENFLLFFMKRTIQHLFS